MFLKSFVLIPWCFNIKVKIKFCSSIPSPQNANPSLFPFHMPNPPFLPQSHTQSEVHILKSLLITKPTFTTQPPLKAFLIRAAYT